MAVKGVGASFKLDNAASPNTLTDISTYLDSIQGSSSQEELDGTTFQPNVAVPVKNTIYGFADKGYSLSGKWSAGAESFFSGVEGLSGLDFEYGPEGTASGKTKISGRCSVGSYSGPIADVNGVITFTVEVKVTSRNANSTY
jgi:hypothetical protein